MANEPPYSSGNYRGASVIDELGQRVHTLETSHKDMTRRIESVDFQVKGLHDQVASIIKDAAINQATMGAKVDSVAQGVNEVKATLIEQAGYKRGGADVEARVERERAKAEAAAEKAASKLRWSIGIGITLFIAAYPFWQWVGEHWVGDIVRPAAVRPDPRP